MKKPNTLLKVVSILCIIGGVLGIVMVILGVMGVGLMASFVTPEDVAELGDGGALAVGALGGAAILKLIVLAVEAVIELLAGIKGRKAENLKTCRILSVLFFFLALWSALMSLPGSSIDLSSIVSYICSLILPILYFIGVKKEIDAR